MKIRLCAWVICGLGLVCGIASAGVLLPEFQGPEFQVNTYTTGDQFDPAVTRDPSGNFVVVWSNYVFDESRPRGSNRLFGPVDDVFGQRFDSSGAPLDSEFQVNSYTTGQQGQPDVAVDNAGNFIVVWRSDPTTMGDPDRTSWDIFGQRYDSAGVPLDSEFQVNSYTPGYQFSPSVARDADGDFVVVWSSYDTYNSFQIEIRAQRFDPGGTPLGSEFMVNESPIEDHGYFSDVASDDAGNFTVVWDQPGDSNNSRGARDQDIFGQAFDSNGAALGGNFQVNSYTTGWQAYPAIDVNDSDGRFVVAWQSGYRYDSDGQDGDRSGVFGQRFNPSATGPTAEGTEFAVNSTTDGAQGNPDVAMDNAGFVVTWDSYVDVQNRGIGDPDVLAQRFDNSGDRVSAEFVVNSYTENFQGYSTIATDGAGSFVVAWQSYDSNYGSYNPCASPACANNAVAGPTSGGDVGQDGSQFGVFTRIVCVPVSGIEIDCTNGVDDDCDGLIDADDRPECDPLVVTLESFEVRQTLGGVVIQWKTASEVDTAGFRILREVAGQPAEPVNLFVIPARGSELGGANYSYRDREWQAPGTRVQYSLEDIDLHGVTTRHAPVEIEIRNPRPQRPSAAKPGAERALQRRGR